MLRTFALGCLMLLSVGCAMSEPVGDDQSAVAAADSAGAGGSDPASGSVVSAGGAAGSSEGGAAGRAAIETGGTSNAGSGGTGGEDTPPPVCAPDQKLCETGCVAKTPEVGCGSLGCSEPCKPPPPNSKATCDGALCDFECLPGFTRDGFACVSQQGTGGAGGSGAGGSGAGGSGAGGSGAGGSGAGGSGAAGGGSPVCVAACNPSDPQSQFMCVAACVLKGGMGLCAPALNCCVCG